MEFRTLSHTPLSLITETFNEAFSDYFIPLQFSEEGMATKWKGEGIEKKYSAGAFADGKLVAFILHGYDEIDGVKTIYNAGTGVIPPFRGKGLTKALYQYSIPLLQKEDIHTHLLEVIDNNHPAKRVYDAVGFQTVRKLGAFRSTAPVTAVLASVEIKKIKSLPLDAAFVSLVPAWQNSTASINRDIENHALIGAFRDGELVGYAAYTPSSGRVKQCAVHFLHRRQKTGTALLQHMLQNSPTGNLLFTNVDETYEPGIEFLTSLCFERILGLYEMKMVVK